jgi:17beta-estradiol 17-dehydrogenase / very-long-chain 3-oxoacyl-CoA reductase
MGLVFIWKRLRSFVLYVFNLAYGKKRDLAAIYGRGSYVLVTGGSEGIGKAMAKEFADRGFNLILVARNQTGLDTAKKEIETVHPGTVVLTSAFDFENITNPVNFDALKALKLDSSLNISVVVSNVGVSQGDFFENLDEERIKRLIKINIGSNIVLASFFHRFWNLQHRRAAFIQTGSVSAINPFPYYDLYGASKAFSQYLTHSLWAFESKYVDWYLFSPSFVATKLNNFRKGPLVVTPEQSAAAAMINVGSYRWEFNGHWKHEVLSAILGLVPDVLLQNQYVRKKVYALKRRGYAGE